MKQIFIHFPRFQISSIDRSSPKKKEKSFKILFHSNPIDQLQNPLLNYLSTYYLILAKKYYKKIVYTKLYPQFSFTFYLSTTTNNLVKTGWVGYECREKKNFVQEDLCRRKIRRKGGRETKGEYGEELEEEEEEEDGGRKDQQPAGTPLHRRWNPPPVKPMNYTDNGRSIRVHATRRHRAALHVSSTVEKERERESGRRTERERASIPNGRKKLRPLLR